MNTTPAAKAVLPRMSGPTYEPKEGDTITVELPDERTRAQIIKVVSDTAVIAKLLTYTTSKSHNYKKGDLVPFRHQRLDMNLPGWRSVSQHEMDEADAASKAKKRKK